jgi:Acyclic terpene utilisation family protein AtuA
MKQTIRIGCGAGFSGDRLEPALILAEQGNLDYLVLECLAERTIALAQKRKLADSSKGYDLLLERRMTMLLPALYKNKIKLITNMGAANPMAAAQKIIELAKQAGIDIKVAAVTGDDVLNVLKQPDTNLNVLETGRPLSSYAIVAANAYLGADAIVSALQQEADIVITGRVADPSLFLAPMMHAFGWKQTDYDLLGKGTVVGHLLECAGQITGGYFADPIKKPVPNMHLLGHPIAEVSSNGTAVITKVEGTGGCITLQTAKEQLLYEVVNPHQYITPDVVADFTTVQLQQQAVDRIRMTGGSGVAAPATLKVSVGYKAHYCGEGEITYAGPAAKERAILAASIIQQRLQNQFADLRIDFIGIQSAHQKKFNNNTATEVRLRIAATATNAANAALVGEEVEALYTNGPAGGGGVRKYTNEVLGVVSVLLPREKATPLVTYFNT